MKASDDFRVRLRQYGLEKHKSMAAFARALEIRPQTLQHYLNGRMKLGSKMIDKLHAMGVDIEWLLYGEQRAHATKFTRCLLIIHAETGAVMAHSASSSKMLGKRITQLPQQTIFDYVPAELHHSFKLLMLNAHESDGVTHTNMPLHTSHKQYMQVTVMAFPITVKCINGYANYHSNRGFDEYINSYANK